MARSDDDTWDISAEGIGSTALGAAGWRARETASERPLVSDPFAQLFVDAADERGISSSRWSDEMLARLQEIDPLLVRQLMAQSTYVASRTKWFDDFFLAAQVAELRQAVILGAGLDTRAWRLPWADGSVVFEVDQPKVLEFKGEVLRSRKVQSACRYSPLGVDLRQDWPKALCDAGFDPKQPTAWSAEGLLVYLPAAAQQLLFDRIQELSADGSRIAVDVTGARFFDPENLGRLSAWFERMRESFGRAGVDLPDTPGMWFDEDRTDVCDWLREHRWTVESVDILDLMARYQRAVPEEESAGIPACDCISGRLS
jgi:methyltransferase (TIGR00027 family)